MVFILYVRWGVGCDNNFSCSTHINMVDTGYNSGGQHFDRSAHSLHIFKDGNLTVHSLRDERNYDRLYIFSFYCRWN